MKTAPYCTERSGNGAQRTFDRRGARAMRLAARPPARFSSLPALETGSDAAAGVGQDPAHAKRSDLPLHHREYVI